LKCLTIASIFFIIHSDRVADPLVPTIGKDIAFCSCGLTLIDQWKATRKARVFLDWFGDQQAFWNWNAPCWTVNNFFLTAGPVAIVFKTTQRTLCFTVLIEKETIFALFHPAKATLPNPAEDGHVPGSYGPKPLVRRPEF
jgi:hypothetical protein